jgi:hypothetical protein
MDEPKKNIQWYLKLAFASYAASFALYLLLSILTLPIWGMAMLDILFSGYAPLIFLVLMLLLAPLVYRRLK